MRHPRTHLLRLAPALLLLSGSLAAQNTHAGGPTAGTAVTAQGARANVREARLDPPVPVDLTEPMEPRIHRGTVAACGRELPCAAGWDLQVLDVGTPGRALPAARRVMVDVRVRNRGARAAPASELQLCLWHPGLNRPEDCEEFGAPVTLPALRPGETMRAESPYLLPGMRFAPGVEARIRAMIDPAQATDERDRSNNAGSSAPFTTEAPALVWEAFEVLQEPTARRPLIVRFRVRNRSAAAASPPAAVQLEGPAGGPCGWGEDSSLHRLELGALAPGQAALATVEFRETVGPRCEGGAYILHATLDPEARHAWGVGHQALHEQPYTIR